MENFIFSAVPEDMEYQPDGFELHGFYEEINFSLLKLS